MEERDRESQKGTTQNNKNSNAELVEQMVKSNPSSPLAIAMARWSRNQVQRNAVQAPKPRDEFMTGLLGNVPDLRQLLVQANPPNLSQLLPQANPPDLRQLVSQINPYGIGGL